MSITSTRTIVVTQAGEGVATTVSEIAVENTTSPGENWLFSSFTGDQVITVPTYASIATASGATIIPPAGNTETLLLKKAAGDTGIKIHKTDPTSIGLDPTETSFIINSSGPVAGLRIIWT